MPASRFDATIHARIVALIAQGIPLKDACIQCDIPHDTVKTWLKKGRSEEKTQYDDFAADVDDAIAAADAELYEDPLPSEEELIRRLNKASKNGHVQATKELLAIRARKDAEDADEDDDPFAEFEAPPDELAPRRRGAR